jgi:hypothetical protein
MPTITELNILEVTPQRFLDNCSAEELYQVSRLINLEKYQDQIQERAGWRIGLLLQAEEAFYTGEFCDQQVTHELLTALCHD